MPGGLMQLVAKGGQDQYLTGSPEFSYFRMVFKRHTNFSMESVRQEFLTMPTLQPTSITSFTCKLGRVADMLQEIFLSFTLPNIYSDDVLRFQWIKNLACYMIHSYTVTIDTQQIDAGYGEWMDVWNELSLPTGKQDILKKMTGNTSVYTTPTSQDTRITIRNNRIFYSYYPTSTGPNDPSIPSQAFYVPMPFWFCKNPALALPLVALQYQSVNINIDFQPIENLYQVWHAPTGMYVSPQRYRELGGTLPVGFENFTAYGTSQGPRILNLQAYLECNYIYLDEAERRQLAMTTIEYIVPQLYRLEETMISSQALIDVVVSNPITEMVWLTRRSDMYRYNDWANYTAAVPEDDTYPILQTAKIMWNGIDRISEKPSHYFNKLQVFQYHTNSAREGVYPYSFALYPEKLQPSGSFNASAISSVQLYVSVARNTPDSPNTTAMFNIIVYSTYLNVFRVLSGSGGMVFAR